MDIAKAKQPPISEAIISCVLYLPQNKNAIIIVLILYRRLYTIPFFLYRNIIILGKITNPTVSKFKFEKNFNIINNIIKSSEIIFFVFASFCMNEYIPLES